jgi:hypothetical protein
MFMSSSTGNPSILHDPSAASCLKMQRNPLLSDPIAAHVLVAVRA